MKIARGFIEENPPVLSEEEEAILQGQYPSVTRFWLGSSCGIRFRTTQDTEPTITRGIVVYPFKIFEDTVTEEQYIKHVQTKNGVLTICGRTA